MSKSTPSTSTTIQQNPLGQAQVPFLTSLWGAGQGMAGLNGAPAAGGDLLSALQALAGGNAAAAGPSSTGLVPGANFDIGSILGGTFGQGGYAGGPQIGALTGWAPGAIGEGTAFGNDLLNAAGLAGNVQPYQNSLAGIGTAAMGLFPQARSVYDQLTQMGGQVTQQLGGYASSAADALSRLSGTAQAGLTGLGSSAIDAISGLSPSAIGAGVPAEQGLLANAGMAISGNPIYDSLRGLASGAYVDPSRNPALPGVIQAATQPLVNQYMTATAPGTTGSAEAAGRYGSGVMANQQGQNEFNLGQALGTTTSGIVNNAYNTGLNAMLGAGSALGSAYNTGVGNVTGALSNMGSLAQQGVTAAGNLLSNAYQTGGNLYNQGYSLGGNLENQAYTTAGNLLNQGYQTGGNLYTNAAGALGNLANTGLGAASNAYSQAGSLGLSGLSGLVQALTGGAQATNAGYTTGGNMLTGAGQIANTGQIGLGGIAQMAPDLANFPLSQLSSAFNSVWAPIQNYGALLGSPVGGNTTTSQTTPYYQNYGANILSGLTGVASLFGGGGKI
jgi:hypothetical protein